MNISKNIEAAAYFINRIKADLPRIKSAKQRDFTIDMLNSFIVLVNTVEQIQKRDPLVKVIESLLLERMYRDMFRYAAAGVGLPLDKIFREISEDIKNPVSAQKEKLVSFLKLEEVTYLADTNQPEKLLQVSDEAWETLVVEKLNDFKNAIGWN